jgi:hypothetical protein
MLPQIEANWRKLADTATADLEPGEREQLVALLERVRESLLALAVDEGAEGREVGAAGETR